jgi:MFS family permease
MDFFGTNFDRLGKGLRTSARDALLSDESTPETRGKVFGFHRAMDTLGAAIGPSIALLLLWLFPGNYVYIFLITAIPGIAAVSLTLLLKEKEKGKYHCYH